MANPNIGRLTCPFQPHRWAYVRQTSKGTHPLYLYCNIAGPVFLRSREGQDWILNRAEMFGPEGEPDDEAPNTEEAEHRPAPEPDIEEGIKHFPEPARKAETEPEPNPEPEPAADSQQAADADEDRQQAHAAAEPDPEPETEDEPEPPRDSGGLLID